MTVLATPRTFQIPPHDPRAPQAFLADELRQRAESGFEVTHLQMRLANIDPAATENGSALESIWRESARLTRRSDWPYEEPDGIAAIEASLPPAQRPAARTDAVDDYASRVLGAWLGRVAGCNLGKPVELGWHWTRSHLAEYLRLANAYPLRDYIPVLDPMPTGFRLREDWPQTTRGNVNGSARDDDIDYAILALHLLETYAGQLTPAAVAAEWLQLLPFDQVFTAERAVYANLVAGIPPEQAAAYRNPYREWIGALIRADVYGYVHPGNPRQAALWAARDAALSHLGNGLYGAMWAAALVSASFVDSAPVGIVTESLRHIPPSSRLHDAVSAVLDGHSGGLTWDQSLDAIDSRWGHLEWVHTVNNAAVIAAGLLYGAGDFATTVGLTVQGGFDTDSNGATAGSVAGVINGAAGLPAHFIDPLHDTTRSALFGFDHIRISELAARTVRVATGLDSAQDDRTSGGSQ